MNTNLIHNVLNVAIVVFGSMAGFDFTVLGLSVAASAKITAGLAAAKLVMNALRDGVAGLVKEQPAVK